MLVLASEVSLSLRSFVRRAASTLSGGAADGPVVQADAIPWAELPLSRLDGEPLEPAALEGRVVLVVNVASRCGFTPQYEGLQALFARLSERGLVVLGVPCNQFAWQERGDADEIGSFCRMTYGVGFPLLEKQDVNGPGRSPLYQHLIGSEKGAGTKVGWNFATFLVGRDGRVIARWDPAVSPEDPALVAQVEAALG